MKIINREAPDLDRNVAVEMTEGDLIFISSCLRRIAPCDARDWIAEDWSIKVPDPCYLHKMCDVLVDLVKQCGYEFKEDEYND